MNGKRPCKSNRPKERATILDDFDHCVIKRTIHGLYSRKYTWLREIIRSITITLLKYPTWGGILPENNTDVDNDHE
jgi:hypothetical protein